MNETKRNDTLIVRIPLPARYMLRQTNCTYDRNLPDPEECAEC